MGFELENLLNILNILNNQSKNDNNNSTNEKSSQIPKEVIDQYPYGQFPERYTKSGQEHIRKNSENRFSYNEDTLPQSDNTQLKAPENNLNITSLLPLIQLMTGKKNQNDSMKLLSQLLFKDNKDMQQLFSLFNKNTAQEIKPNNNFPNTNKVNISALKRV